MNVDLPVLIDAVERVARSKRGDRHVKAVVGTEGEMKRRHAGRERGKERCAAAGSNLNTEPDRSPTKSPC